MPEMLLSMLILAFLAAATASLYTVGQAQHHTAKGYSQVQTDVRRAMARVTRTIRHGYSVVGTSSLGTLNGLSSAVNDQIIVEVPEPSPSTAKRQIRFYRSNAGVLYYQDHTQAAPGTALMTGLQVPREGLTSGEAAPLTFHYYQSIPDLSGAVTTTNVDANPSLATEVRITITARSAPVSTTVRAYVSLRNSLQGL